MRRVKVRRTASTLRVPYSLRLRLQAAADRAGLSLNEWICRCLEREAGR